MAYQILLHTVDLRLQVEAVSPQELFVSALEGMNQIIQPNFCATNPATPIRQTIALQSPDQTSLLIDFLNEVLTRSRTARAIFCQLNFDSLKETSLKASIAAARVDGFAQDIKSVSYRASKIIKKGNKFLVIIVFEK